MYKNLLNIFKNRLFQHLYGLFSIIIVKVYHEMVRID